MTDLLSSALVSVRVSARGAEEAIVFARSHSFVVGKPLSFDEKDPRLSAVEYFAGTLSAEIVSGLKMLAARQRLVVDDVEARGEARLAHPLAHIGVVGEEEDPHVSGFRLQVYLSTFEPGEKIAALWAEALRRSPLLNTLKRAIPLELSFQIVS